MQEDFHYYATYCAAAFAGYDHGECMDICYSAQFVDLCSRTLLNRLEAPAAAATTQFQLEMMDARTDIIGLQDITRIWASFHFLPRDLYARKEKRTKRYMNKYRLICGPDGELVKSTVELAKNRPLASAGIAMHVLADTWAHSYFAGTPSLVINNISDDLVEILPEDGDGNSKESESSVMAERAIRFRHNPATADEPEKGIYTNTIYQRSENSIMNLGHGRAGHLPDYSFIRYRYMPAWDDYRIKVKDNPSDYLHAFCQMIYALKNIRGSLDSFETGKYDFDAIKGYEDRIKQIIGKRQLSASADWKRLGEDLTGSEIENFDIERHQSEYMEAAADEKDSTYLGSFISGAMAHKGMVCDRISASGNILAGFVANAKEKAGK